MPKLGIYQGCEELLQELLFSNQSVLKLVVLSILKSRVYLFILDQLSTRNIRIMQ